MATERIELEGLVELEAMEDGRQAMIASLIGDQATASDGCMFVRLQSWDESVPADDRHKLLGGLLGKRIRVTIETI
jgi:hypothetical protein